MKSIHVNIGKVTFGNDLPFVFIGGPDSLESYRKANFFASSIKNICNELSIPFVFKASFDKANRTFFGSFRGVGIVKGMKILKKLKQDLNILVTTDIHLPEHARQVIGAVDLIQIPALLSRQTDMIVAAARTGKAINVKKGQFMSPYDIEGVISKVEATKNKNLLLTERGYMFGYQNLVSDMRSIEIMKNTGYPVVFDASHSVQLPSSMGKASGGERKFIFPLAKAAVAVGVAGIFMEVYDNPKKAPVDGPNSFLLKDLKKALKMLVAIDKVVKNY